MAEIQSIEPSSENQRAKKLSCCETLFWMLCRTSAVRSVSLELIDGRLHGGVPGLHVFVHFVTGNGITGVIHTQRRTPKRYHLRAVAVFLSECGLPVSALPCDLSKMSQTA